MNTGKLRGFKKPRILPSFKSLRECLKEDPKRYNFSYWHIGNEDDNQKGLKQIN